MADAEPITQPSVALATPFALAFAWADAVGEMTRASMGAWSALASRYVQANEACAALLRQTIDLERAETLAVGDSADRLLRSELRALEGGADRLVSAAEDTLAGMAPGPLPSLPD